MIRGKRAVLLWIMGSILILIGAMIGGKVEMNLGITLEAYLVAVLIALILIMIGGLLWISISVAFSIKKEE